MKTKYVNLHLRVYHLDKILICFLTILLLCGCEKRQEYNWELRAKVEKTWLKYSKHPLVGKQMDEQFGMQSYRLASKKAVDLQIMDEFFATMQQNLATDSYLHDTELHDSSVFRGNWYAYSSLGRIYGSIYELPAEALDESKSFEIMRIHTYYHPITNDGIVLLSSGKIPREEFLSGLVDKDRMKKFPVYLTIYLDNDFKKFQKFMIENGNKNLNNY